MTRKTAAVVLLAVLGLLLIGTGLSLRLLRAGLRTARVATEERLQAIGQTAALSLEHGPDDPDELADLLGALCRDNQIEDAYLLSPMLRPVAVGRPAQGPEPFVDLLRIDPDRAMQAVSGKPQVGFAYRLDSLGRAAAEVLAGYFPVRGKKGQIGSHHLADENGTRILVLEAGPAFSVAPARLLAAAFGAIFVAAALAVLCIGTLLFGLRVAERERLLYGRAERGAAISQMAAMLAHEIRNPLGTIRAGAELLREGRPGQSNQNGRPGQHGQDDQDGEILADILSEVGRLTALCGEFLTLSRDPPLCLSEVDVAALCDDLCEQVRRRVREKAGLAPRPDDAPVTRVQRDGAPTATITADAGKLHQALLNLALNAIEAQGGVGLLRLSVRSVHRGGVEVLIRDDGPGVDEGLSRRLFEPFATGKSGGTGLGLVISRRIAERHGGSLALLPTPAGERGACFSLTLPRRPPGSGIEQTERQE